MTREDVAMEIARAEDAEAISRACVALTSRLTLGAPTLSERATLQAALDTMRDALAISVGAMG